MKTTKKWSKMLLAGMSALVLTFGLLVVVGCDDGGGDDPPAQGILTIINIPDGHDGEYVGVYGGFISGAAEIYILSDINATTPNLDKVSGTSASVPLNTATDEGTFSAYTGSDTAVVNVSLYTKIDSTGKYVSLGGDARWESVKFTGGNATVDWKDKKISP
ncbi:hypothetical protein FACS1894102_5830 [Spirochaetia bacterium]|nr:hypothetical protein FACS1894102_5830 [Spirochaetia bacterium]